MNFGELMEVVLNKMVVPKYAPIDCVVYKEYGNVTKGRYWEITYMIKEDNVSKVSRLMKQNIILNTITLVSMCGIEVRDDYAVHFSDGKRKLYLI